MKIIEKSTRTKRAKFLRISGNEYPIKRLEKLSKYRDKDKRIEDEEMQHALMVHSLAGDDEPIELFLTVYPFGEKDVHIHMLTNISPFFSAENTPDESEFQMHLALVKEVYDLDGTIIYSIASEDKNIASKIKSEIMLEDL